MSSAVDSAKEVVDRGKGTFADLRERWEWLDHLVRTVGRYNDRRGNLYAVSITFNGILALIPIVMVGFAIAGFVLASDPDLIRQIQDSVVRNMPGQLGDQVKNLINSAIDSRATIGVVGLLAAALTGIGWISGVRIGMTEMWGGRVSRNPVTSKIWDLVTFVVLGIAFAVTMGLSALGNSGLARTVLSWVGLDDAWWAPAVVRVVAIVVSVGASWLLFTLVMSRLPLVRVPFRNTMRAGLLAAVIFEIVKSVGSVYLKSVLSSPAGAAFGPIIGIMVFGYLASRIILYVTAWCATDRQNTAYQVTEEGGQPPPVVVSPTYDVAPVPRPAILVAAAGLGATASAIVGRLLRR